MANDINQLNHKIAVFIMVSVALHLPVSAALTDVKRTTDTVGPNPDLNAKPAEEYRMIAMYAVPNISVESENAVKPVKGRNDMMLMYGVPAVRVITVEDDAQVKPNNNGKAVLRYAVPAIPRKKSIWERIKLKFNSFKTDTQTKTKAVNMPDGRLVNANYGSVRILDSSHFIF